MDYKHEKETEKHMLERDAAMLIIGLIIAMVIVALTLNVPDGPYPAFDKQCYETCKKITNKSEIVKSKQFLSTTRYIIEINKCMDACEEAKNENSSQSLAP
jgi:hypothetical protein